MYPSGVKRASGYHVQAGLFEKNSLHTSDQRLTLRMLWLNPMEKQFSHGGSLKNHRKLAFLLQRAYAKYRVQAFDLAAASQHLHCPSGSRSACSSIDYLFLVLSVALSSPNSFQSSFHKQDFQHFGCVEWRELISLMLLHS